MKQSQVNSLVHMVYAYLINLYCNTLIQEQIFIKPNMFNWLQHEFL